MRRVLFGALAGLSASMTTTTVMRAALNHFPVDKRRPLPHREAADSVLGGKWDEERREEAALAAHLAIGAAAGALMPLVNRKTSVTQGAAYGLGVGVLNYLGWIPAVQLIADDYEPPVRRNALMAAAHVVWGALAANIFTGLEKSRTELFGKR